MSGVPGSGTYGIRAIRRILLIGVSEITLARQRRVLIGAGFEVLLSTQLVGNTLYLPSCDLVVVDVEMPGLKTSSAIDAYRSVLYAARKKCLIFLHIGGATSGIGHRDAGFDGVFTDRADAHALVRQIQALFEAEDGRVTAIR